jgi:hypothetical protein
MREAHRVRPSFPPIGAWCWRPDTARCRARRTRSRRCAGLTGIRFIFMFGARVVGREVVVVVRRTRDTARFERRSGEGGSASVAPAFSGSPASGGDPHGRPSRPGGWRIAGLDGRLEPPPRNAGLARIFHGRTCFVNYREARVKHPGSNRHMGLISIPPCRLHECSWNMPLALACNLRCF